MPMERTIAQNIENLKLSIKDAAEKAQRDPELIRWVLVSKLFPVEAIQEAFACGIQDFGESRAQEYSHKKEQLPSHIRWHFIGHLQSNKVKYLLNNPLGDEVGLPLIHSLDRRDLAGEIERQAGIRGISRVPCLIQVNSSEETSKRGFSFDDVYQFVSDLGNESAIWLRGLMTIAPLTKDQERIRKAFRSVKELQKKLADEFPNRDWNILSMGMSGDYKIAIEEGANLLRIGTAVFGQRAKKND